MRVAVIDLGQRQIEVDGEPTRLVHAQLTINLGKVEAMVHAAVRNPQRRAVGGNGGYVVTAEEVVPAPLPATTDVGAIAHLVDAVDRFLNRDYDPIDCAYCSFKTGRGSTAIDAHDPTCPIRVLVELIAQGGPRP